LREEHHPGDTDGKDQDCQPAIDGKGRALADLDPGPLVSDGFGGIGGRVSLMALSF